MRRGAGVGDDALGPVADLARVDLRHDQRHVGVAAQRGAVVDDDHAAGRGELRPSARGDGGGMSTIAMSTPSKNSGVSSSTTTSRRRTAQRRCRRPRRPRPAGSSPQMSVAHRAAPLGSRPADGTGGADQCRGSARGPRSLASASHVTGRCPRRPRLRPRVESSPNAVCTARTASSSRSARVTTEMRISEVEIISMLTPALASALKNVAETPGCERMPAPTSESLPIWSSYWIEAKPDRRPGSSAGPAPPVCAVGLGAGERDVGQAGVGGRDVLDDHVDVDLGVGAAPGRSAAALPGWSGTPTTVTLASLRSWATPAMIGASTASPSAGWSVTMVPSFAEKELRTWMGMSKRRAYSTLRRCSTLEPGGGQLEHLLVGDAVDLAGGGHDARVGGEHAVDVGVDLAHLGA